MNTHPSHDGSLLWSLQSFKLLKLIKCRQLKSKCCCKLGINSDHWPRMTVWSYSTWETGQMALKSHSGVFCKLGSPCLGHSKIYVVVFLLKGQASVLYPQHKHIPHYWSSSDVAHVTQRKDKQGSEQQAASCVVSAIAAPIWITMATIENVALTNRNFNIMDINWLKIKEIIQSPHVTLEMLPKHVLN